jgi:hypothetical protein
MSAALKEHVMVPIGSLLSFAAKAWETLRTRSLKALAWNLRDYADQQKRKEPNLYCFSRAALARQLGRNSQKIREVLEFMESQGWAQKVRLPVDCWQVK